MSAVAAEPMLQVSGLCAGYGPVDVLQQVSLEVRRGEIVSLIGANGAGKSSTLRCISRIHRARAGELRFQGRDLNRLPAHEVVACGLAHVPEGRRIFPRLTVRENLEMGAYRRHDADGIAKDLEHVHALFPILRDRARQQGGTLSGGEQQMLAIGRGLMSEPSLLIMDEPSLGLSPLLVEQMFELIQRINREGMPILLMEQNAVQTLAIAHRAYIIENGAVALQGPAAELARDPELRRNYLGL